MAYGLHDLGGLRAKHQRIRHACGRLLADWCGIWRRRAGRAESGAQQLGTAMRRQQNNQLLERVLQNIAATQMATQSRTATPPPSTGPIPVGQMSTMPQALRVLDPAAIAQMRRIETGPEVRDPRLDEADQLTAQAAPPKPIQGAGRQMVRGALEGIASLGHPQGFSGYRNDQLDRERQRQQDLLERAKQLRGESVQQQELQQRNRQIGLQEQNNERSYGIDAENLALNKAKFAHDTELQNRPKLTNIPSDQTYGTEDPTTGRFTAQGQTPKTLPQRTETEYTRWAAQQPAGSDTSINAFWKARTDATQRESFYGEPLTQVRTRDASGREVTRFLTRSQQREMAEGGQDLPAANPSTGGEKRAMDFYLAAETAAKVADSLESEVAKLGLAGQTRLTFAPNFLQSDVGKQYNQAIRQFTEARLRLVSGAQVREDEYANTAKIYFPYPGDDAPTLAQKKLAREEIMKGIRQEAGRAYSEYYGVAQPGASGGGADPLGIR